MSDYTKSTNFAVKDGLTTGDPAKRIKGTEIDVEYNAIASAIASKADANSPTFTGTPVAPTAAPGTNTTQLSTTAFVKIAAASEASSAITTERTATATITNKTISADDNTISGIAASSFVLSNDSGNIDGSAAQKAIPNGVVVGTTDTQTLTNKTIAFGSNTVSGTKAQFNTAVTDTDIAFLNDFTGSNQSLNSSGYQKLPGGLIIQWGKTANIGGDASLSVTFPIAFPTAVFNGQVTAGSNNSSRMKITSLTTTAITIVNNDSSAPAYWIAIGY